MMNLSAFVIICAFTLNFSFLPSVKSADLSNPDFRNGHYVHELEPGTPNLLLQSPGSTRLEVFCYQGNPCTISTLLKTVELVIVVPGDNFHFYEGVNVSSVRNQYKEQPWLSFSPWKPSYFRLNVFNYSCVGIETTETFTAHLNVRYLDFWRLMILFVGTALFFSAPLLAHNVVFHYMTGVSVGVFGSLLVVVFVMSKLIPKKMGAFAFLIGGWGLILYSLQYTWTNCLSLIQEYQAVLAGYVTLAGLTSFAIVYRFGPIENVRSLRLVQWMLQLFGMSLIFISSQCKEFTIALMMFLLIYYNIPRSWMVQMKTYWLRYFPPKHRFLTEDEYLEQSRSATKKSLEDLREFCHSPDCNAWKLMHKLKSPSRFAERSILSTRNLLVAHRSKEMGLCTDERFAEFVEGSCHITDDEILNYESAIYNHNPLYSLEMMLTDDEEELEGATLFRK